MAFGAPSAVKLSEKSCEVVVADQSEKQCTKGSFSGCIIVLGAIFFAVSRHWGTIGGLQSLKTKN